MRSRSSNPLGNDSQAREMGSLSTEYELHYWLEQLAARERRLRELRCAQAVQSTLLALESELHHRRSSDEQLKTRRTNEGMRTQARLLTVRLDALEDESIRLWAEQGHSALETRRKADILSKRCGAKRIAIRSWPEATIERLATSFDAQRHSLQRRFDALEEEVATNKLLALDEEATGERFFADAHRCAETTRRMLNELDDALVTAATDAAESTRKRMQMQESTLGKQRAADLERFELACTQLRAAEAETKMLIRATFEAAQERAQIVSKLSEQQDELEMQVMRAHSERAELVERSSKLQALEGSARMQ